MKVELVPYQTIMLSAAGTQYRPSIWVPPREESVDAMGYNYGKLMIQVQTQVPPSVIHPGLTFVLEHSQDNLWFEPLLSSKVEILPNSSSTSVISIDLTAEKQVTEFSRYLRPRLISGSAAGAGGSAVWAIRVQLQLSKWL